MSRTSKKSYFKRRKTPMLNLGTVYVSDTLREITKKMKSFFDEYSVEVAPPSRSYPGKNAYKVKVRGVKKSGYSSIFK